MVACASAGDNALDRRHDPLRRAAFAEVGILGEVGVLAAGEVGSGGGVEEERANGGLDLRVGLGAEGDAVRREGEDRAVASRGDGEHRAAEDRGLHRHDREGGREERGGEEEAGEVRAWDDPRVGEDRLRDMVLDSALLPVQVVADRIVDAVHAFVREAPQHDDITLVVARVRAGVPNA